MAVHSNVRPHVCDICGKSFKQTFCLSRHKLTHQDSKPLTCEYCGKGFISNWSFKGHLRTHTGEKPYKCDLCDAAFTHNVTLKNHKKSAHGIGKRKEEETSTALFDASHEGKLVTGKSIQSSENDGQAKPKVEATTSIQDLSSQSFLGSDGSNPILHAMQSSNIQEFGASHNVLDNMLIPDTSVHSAPWNYQPHRDPHQYPSRIEGSGKSFTKL